MRRVSGRHQARSAASSTSSTTSSDITEHFSPERWVRPLYVSVFFFFSLIVRTSLLSSGVRASAIPEGFACVESRFGHFRTIIHDPSAHVAAISAIDKEIDEQLKAVDEHLRAVDAARQLFRSQLAHHNALTPIFVLPPQVLAWVFHFLVFDVPEDGIWAGSEPRLPLLASSRPKQFVIMGHNIGDLGKNKVDFRDVSSREECTAGHQH